MAPLRTESVPAGSAVLLDHVGEPLPLGQATGLAQRLGDPSIPPKPSSRWRPLSPLVQGRSEVLLLPGLSHFSPLETPEQKTSSLLLDRDWLR